MEATSARQSSAPPITEAQLRHPLERPVFAVSVVLNIALMCLAVYLATYGSDWLAGHKVFDSVVLPGTAFVELALVAAHHLGLGSVDELTIEAPLLLPPLAPIPTP